MEHRAERHDDAPKDVAPPSLDETDNHILAILSENSRKTFVDMARTVGLSAPAVRRRTERLKRDGAIEKFTIIRGDERASAMVLVSVESGHDTAKISERLALLDGVRTVYEITGQYDIVAIVRARTISGINTCIDSLRESPGVKDTNTVIILRKVA